MYDLDGGKRPYLIVYVKLRDHPLMSYHHVGNWPPVWASEYDDQRKNLRGEIGILVEVAESKVRDDRIVLVMNYEDQLYGAALTFSDKAFGRKIFAILKQSIGMSLPEIGEIELGHTL